METWDAYLEVFISKHKCFDCYPNINPNKGRIHKLFPKKHY